jgi:hypothetical protein
MAVRVRRETGGRAPSSEARNARPLEGETSRRTGERRIVVDGVVYYWRVPRRANTNQEDLIEGLFVLVRRSNERGAVKIVFPQMHGAGHRGTYRTAVERARRRELQAAGAFASPPVLPRHVARAIRAMVEMGWSGHFNVPRTWVDTLDDAEPDLSRSSTGRPAPRP